MNNAVKISENKMSIHNRKKRVRQDRLEIPDLRCHLYLDSNNYEVINISAFGIAIKSKMEFVLGSSLTNCILKIEDLPVGQPQLTVARIEKVGDSYHIGLEVNAHPISVETVTAVTEALRLKQDIEAKLAKNKLLSEEFRLTVYEMKELLESIEGKIKEFEVSRKFLSKNDQDIFEAMIIKAFSLPIYECIRGGNIKLRDLLQKADKETVEFGFAFFRNQLKSYLYQSPFADRSFKKPLGYPGDFEMMRLIYRNEAFGDTLFGKCMEQALQLFPEPDAVRNRAKYLSGKIVEYLNRPHNGEVYNILSVACGPAFEWEIVLNQLKDKSRVPAKLFLLDQDEAALKTAQRRILELLKKKNLSLEVELINLPIKRVIMEGLHDHMFDLIYSAGLFDYFTDPVAVKASQMLFQNLKPNGDLIIGNFDIGTPNQFGMRTVFDWDLVYRSKDDLVRLYDFPNSQVKIQSEKNGINLFCNIRKKHA